MQNSIGAIRFLKITLPLALIHYLLYNLLLIITNSSGLYNYLLRYQAAM